MDEKIRINKYLSASGVCSRRTADRYIDEGRVTIDGKTASLGDTVDEANVVCVDGREVRPLRKRSVIIYNKPKGVVCTLAGFDKRNIYRNLDLKERVYPVGRLDKDSEGLVILTNDGELTNKILHPSHAHEREYVVRLQKPVTDDFLQNMRKGVRIVDEEKNIDTVTLPCVCEKLSKYEVDVVLKQGINRQIRRMCKSLNNRVLALKRVRMLNLRLDGLNTGEYRYLSDREIAKLYRLLDR